MPHDDDDDDDDFVTFYEALPWDRPAQGSPFVDVQEAIRRVNEQMSAQFDDYFIRAASDRIPHSLPNSDGVYVITDVPKQDPEEDQRRQERSRQLHPRVELPAAYFERHGLRPDRD